VSEKCGLGIWTIGLDTLLCLHKKQFYHLE
jgi:hypothetical protein